MRKRHRIQTPSAPAAIGPYSQAIETDGLVFASGQIPLAPDGTDMIDKPVADQTRQVLENLSAVLAAAGTSLDRVAKATVFMTDLSEFAEMNRVYGQYFSEPFPARAAVQVAALPKNTKVEIEAIAVK